MTTDQATGPPQVQIVAQTLAVVSLAMVHNRVPLVTSLSLTNHGPELSQATVGVQVRDGQGPVSRPWQTLVDLPEGGTTELTDLDLHIDGDAMLQVEERRPGTVQVTVEHDDEQVADWHGEVTVLAGRQWLQQPERLGLEMLAAHVMPNSPDVAQVLGEAADLLEQRTGSGSIQGYQGGAERVDQIVHAIFDAVRAREVRYSNPPASWSEQGQKVRTPSEVLEGRVGTCLDTTVVLAAALEQAGLHPLLWMLRGHSFAGWWREETSLDAIVTEDPSPLVNLIDLDIQAVVETTALTDPAPEVTFAGARAAALRHLRDLTQVTGVVDVFAARRNMIVPLPARTRTASGEVAIVEYRPATHSTPTPQLERRPQRPVGTEPARPVPPRVEQWKNALLDLSLRNRLINFTDRYAVSLTVPPGRLAAMEDVVHDGKMIPLRASDQVPEVYRARGVRLGRDLPTEHLHADFDTHAALFTDVTSAAYVTRLRNLTHQARTVLEETGANNLYLAMGSLAWSLDGRELRSPLILVPVQLRTTGRGERTTYKISLDESGASTPNYCLLEKLKQTHGLSIPALTEPVEDLSGIDLAATLQAVRVAVAQAGLPFHVEETAHLAMLAFAKFRLWKDLSEDWETLLANPLAGHLAHTPTEPFADPVAEPTDLDLDALAAECPIPADGSQLTSVAGAVAGTTFVLEGPPGTGKSQTITNLLARSLAQGKRVLFVAEKRAALDVVKTRLDAVGMGPFSLDLHDKGSSPNVVRQQIKAALEHRVSVDEEGLAARIEELRASTRTLRRYAERLHEPNGAGLSLYSARTALLALAGPEHDQLLPVPPQLLAGAAAAAEVSGIRGLLGTLPEIADPARPGAVTPWGFVGLDELPEDAVADIREQVGTIEELLPAVPTTGRLGAAVRAARCAADLVTLAHLARAGAGTSPPSLSLLDETTTPRWRQATSGLQDEVAAFAGAAHPGMDTAVHPGLDAATPAALDLPLDDLNAAAQAAAASSVFGRKNRLRAVLEQLQPGLREGAQVAPKQVPELTAALVAVQGAVAALAGRAGVIPGLVLAKGWNPLTEPGRETLERQVQWLTWAGEAVHRADPESSGRRTDPAALRERSPFTEAVRGYLDGAETADPEGATSDPVDTLLELAQATEALTKYCGSTEQQVTAWSGDEGFVGRWQQSAARRDAGNPQLGSLRRWVALRAHLRPLLEAGMSPAHHLLLSGQVDADDAVRSLDRGLAQASLRERHTSSGLDGFDTAAHERSIVRFNRASDDVRTLLTDHLQQQVVEARPFSSSSTMGRIGALARELERRRGGLRVRELIQTYGELITQLMPCVLVSPDSLARFFPVTAEQFDLVVFDEASQIRVADSIGAIGRARSVVVVGDSKQMPPTSFAEPILTSDQGRDTAAAEEMLAVEDEESILSECVLARVRRHWLSWHYRSQDESLIAFSNQRYYEGRLSSFPAPTTGTADPGVHGHGINLVRVDGTFHRSGKGGLLRTNPVEAEAIVADLQRRFAAHRGPGAPSVGVVTFNQQQRDLIEARVRDHEDPRLAESLDAALGEGLFVKNLENVQGDERDTILFSTAFSVNERGVLPLNFGPLNRSGGERRLNVAVTRARRQVVLYSSFDPAQLRAEETTSVGVKHLRAYLELAASGTASMEAAVRRGGAMDRHREEVAAALRERGLVVDTDVGLSDFRIDACVSLPEEPQRRVMAIIMDGPGWARRVTVGDRDGLPVLVLEGILGWPRVARVWLPDWLADPQRCVEDLYAAALAAAKEPAEAVAPAPAPALEQELEQEPEPEPKEPPEPAAPDEPPEPAALGEPLEPAEPGPEAELLPGEQPFVAWDTAYRGSQATLRKLENPSPARRVREALLACVAQEGPVHRERLARAVAAAFGLTRLGAARVTSILALVPPELVCPGEPDFYWSGPGEYAEWTGFRSSDDDVRPAEQIAVREVANSMRGLCLASAGAAREELLRGSLAVFGGQRLTPGIRERMAEALAFGLREGLLTDSGDVVHAAEDRQTR